MRSRTVGRARCGAAGLVGLAVGLALTADHDTVAASIGHVLVAMAGPWLIARAGPISALLRLLPATTGRRLVRALRHPPLRWLTEPTVAATLDVGGLWVLWSLGLFPTAHLSPGWHAALHLHLIVAGVLFSTTLVGVDPLPHRRGLGHRTLVWLVAVAAHDVLAKVIYAESGGSGPVRRGAMIMYYGGDVVSVLIMVLLGAEWYRARKPRPAALPTG